MFHIGILILSLFKGTKLRHWKREEFSTPKHLAIDDQIFDHYGKFMKGWGNYGSENGAFSDPTGVAINNDFISLSNEEACLTLPTYLIVYQRRKNLH